MNVNWKIIPAAAGVVCLMALLGECSGGMHTEQQEYSVSEVSTIAVDYDGERITVSEGGDKIVLVETLNKSKKSYRAKISLAGGVLTVTEGARPIGNGVRAALELRVPKGYLGEISLHSTAGSISCGALTLDRFSANTTNGSVEVTGLDAKQIELTTTGGSIRLADATGAGRFTASGDGGMELAFSKVTGDITADAKNGDILLTLPENTGFTFTARAKNGRISTPFPTDEKNATAEVGGGGANISVENKNGDIAVSLK